MNLFNRMTLRSSLTILLTIPLVALIWFAQGEIRRTSQLKSQTDHIIKLANVAVSVSALVHELQKERGLSAGYLSSNGREFASELRAQHLLSDKKITEMRDIAASLDASYFGDEFAKQLDRGMVDLGRVSTTRSAISAQSVSVAEGIGYYTALNTQFLDLAWLLAKGKSAGSGSVTNSAAAYVAFMQSKERAGIERAVLAAVFAADRFSHAQYSHLQQLIAAQDTYMSVFRSLVTSEQLAFVDATLQGGAIDETTSMRRIAINNAQTGGFGIDPAAWFDAQTRKIDLLRSVENRLSNDFHALTKAIQERATSDAGVAFAVAILSVVLCTFFGIVIVRSILNRLGADPRRLGEVVEAIASNNLDLDLTAKREPTGIYANMCMMQKNLRERIEADKQALVETGRVQEALNCASSAVAITDADLRIVYVNKAAAHLIRQLGTGVAGLDTSNLVGCSIEGFYSGLSKLRHALSTQTASYTTESEISGKKLTLVANPVIGQDGEPVGAVFEFNDHTQEFAVQRRVQKVVDSALCGDLSQRIAVDDMSGFFAELSTAVNRLVEVAEQIIQDTMRVLGAVAEGSLTKTIDNEYQGSFDQLKQDANATVAKLTEVVTRIKQATDGVRTGASEISQGNADLSQRTEEQASSLEQTASSMEEMTSTVCQNAENAGQANQLVLAAREQAEAGGSVVRHAVQAMEEINASSRKISDIISVIDEIAFQTNLLALNASVEAARAGEQGRGFAVVASEVRNLAGRSAIAAKEIKELIVDSERKVKEGSRLVNESGESLEAIVTGVQKVTDIVGEIAAASQEQSAGIEEVSKTIMQMDNLTQQNAALVEQAAAASESLSNEANSLNSMMTFFSVSDTEDASAQSVVHQTPPKRTERRSSERPWNSTQDASSGSAAVDSNPRQAALVADDTDEWEEF